MSATQYLQDVSTRHQVFLERFAKGRSRDAIMMLNRLRRDIRVRLSQEPTEFQSHRLTALLKDIEGLANKVFADIGVQVAGQVKKLAPIEAEYSADLFGKVTKLEAGYILPTSEIVAAAALQSHMAVGIAAGITPEEALTQFGRKKTQQILQQITDSVVLGQTSQQIASEVSSTMTTLQPRQVRTLVQTIVNHTSSVARNEVYKSNEKVLEGFTWIATLDSKTTLICASRDQQTFRIGIDPMPPAHYNCRSTTIPAVRPEFQIARGGAGTRPSIGADGVEQVGSGTSYGSWLKRQPKEFIDEALGVERSKLFRSGKMPISKFVDPTGRVYTLQELEGMKPISMIET